MRSAYAGLFVNADRICRRCGTQNASPSQIAKCDAKDRTLDNVIQLDHFLQCVLQWGVEFLHAHEPASDQWA